MPGIYIRTTNEMVRAFSQNEPRPNNIKSFLPQNIRTESNRKTKKKMD